MNPGTGWLHFALRCMAVLSLNGFAAQSWASMWVAGGSPTVGTYTVSWNSNPAGCSSEDVYPPYGYYVEICNTLQEKAGSGGWITVSAAGTSNTFSGKAPNTYQYRLLIATNGGAPTVIEWLPSVVVSSAPVISTTFRKCIPNSANACNNAYAMGVDMVNSGLLSALPYGTMIVSSSQSLPISALLTVCSAGASGAKWACALTNSAQMVALDNKMYARAALVDPIEIPSNIAPTAVQAGPYEPMIAARIQSTLTWLGVPGQYGFDTYHAITNFTFQAFYANFVDGRDGMTKKIYVFDTITVRFSDKSTAQFQLLGNGLNGGLFFSLVAGSERDVNGDPFAVLSPQAASPTGNTGIVVAVVFNGVDHITADLIMNHCMTKITYSDAAGGTPTYYRKEVVCPH